MCSSGGSVGECQAPPRTRTYMYRGPVRRPFVSCAVGERRASPRQGRLLLLFRGEEGSARAAQRGA